MKEMKAVINAYLAVMLTIVLMPDEGRLREEAADEVPLRHKLPLDEPEPEDDEAEEIVQGEC